MSRPCQPNKQFRKEPRSALHNRATLDELAFAVGCVLHDLHLYVLTAKLGTRNFDQFQSAKVEPIVQPPDGRSDSVRSLVIPSIEVRSLREYGLLTFTRALNFGYFINHRHSEVLLEIPWIGFEPTIAAPLPFHDLEDRAGYQGL